MTRETFTVTMRDTDESVTNAYWMKRTDDPTGMPETGAVRLAAHEARSLAALINAQTGRECGWHPSDRALGE